MFSSHVIQYIAAESITLLFEFVSQQRRGEKVWRQGVLSIEQVSRLPFNFRKASTIFCDRSLLASAAASVGSS